MKLFYAAGLFLTSLLAGCRSDTQPDLTGPAYDLTGKYLAGSTIVAAHPITMYTKAGQVTDQAVVTRFLARRPTPAAYFSATDVPFSSQYALSLVFRTNNRATIISASPTYTDSMRLEVTNREPAGFLLQRLDSISQPPVQPGMAACNRVGTLAEYIRGAKAGKKCWNASLSSGTYGQSCRVRPVYAVGAHGSQLYVPYYSWLIQAGGCYTAVGGEWNTFGQEVVAQLAAGDTVVVQERELALRR